MKFSILLLVPLLLAPTALAGPGAVHVTPPGAAMEAVDAGSTLVLQCIDDARTTRAAVDPGAPCLAPLPDCYFVTVGYDTDPLWLDADPRPECKDVWLWFVLELLDP